MKILAKENVRDPETLETYLRGTHDVNHEQAYRLLSYHAGRVEELNADSLAQKKKEEVVEVARAAGVEVDPSENKDEIVKAVAGQK